MKTHAIEARKDYLFHSTFILSFIFLLFNFSALSQSVGINATGATPDSSALLDLNSSTKGFLITRADTANIQLPAFGLMTLSPVDSCLYMYSGIKWISQGGVGSNCPCAGSSSTTTTPPNNFTCGDNIQDIDGNTYGTVQIGSQCWTTSNLNVTKYNDGTSIHEEQDANTWNTYTLPAFCWYSNDPTNGNTYGALYNWFVVNQGDVCPTGWHVPSDGEWCQMENAVEANVDPSCSVFFWRGTHVGENLKATSWDGDNTSGFTGLPSGYRWGGVNNTNKGIFDGIGSMTQIWTATADGTNSYGFPAALKRNLNAGNNGVFRQRVAKQDGLPIRCVKN